MVITGGSAGGYTTLAALAFRDVFKAGGSHFGVSDLSALARDTHKFESRYLDWLIGPYPQEEALYRARSPLFHAERIAVPVVFFQGDEDAVVPPNQAEMMVEALRARGIPGGLPVVRRRAARLPPSGQHQARARRRAAVLRDAGVQGRADVLGTGRRSPSS
jgi:dipeptidyl aminopeptidase/acylaminoacyl peptidase